MGSEQETKLFRVLVRLWRMLFSMARDYIVIVRGRAEGAGFATLRSISRGGPLNWLGLVVLFINVVSAAYLGLQGRGFPIVRAEIWEGEEVMAPLPALYLSLFVVSFGWSCLLVGAATSGLGIYVLTAAYAAYYGLYVGLGLGGTPWFALIPIWLLALGGWVASSRRTRWRLPLLLLVSLMVALLTRSSLGLKAILPGTRGTLVLGGLYFALVANPWVMKERPFKPCMAFAVSVVLFALFYALSLQQSPAEEVLANAFLAFHGLLGLVGLFWFWLGLDLFNGAQDLAEWLVVTIKALVPHRILGVSIFSLWALWCTLAYLLVHGPPPGLARLLLNYNWGKALMRAYLSLEPSVVALLSALDYDLYLTAAIALLASVLWWLRKLSRERLMGLFGLSLVGFFIIWGYFGLFFAFPSADQGGEFGFWPLLIFVGGMLWETLQVASGLVSGPRERSLLFLGFLLLLGGISILELSTGYPYFEQELSLNSFLGVLYLGLPYLLYTSLYQQQRYTPVSSRHLLLLFALGMLSAIPSLVWERIFLAPLFWLMALAATVWRWGGWDDLWDGVVYTVALALGFVIFYTHPILIPIPTFTGFLSRFLELQSRYRQIVIWPWEAAWWWLLLGMLGAAVILGYLLSQARMAQRRARTLFLILGPSLSLVFLVAWEFVFVGAH